MLESHAAPCPRPHVRRRRRFRTTFRALQKSGSGTISPLEAPKALKTLIPVSGTHRWPLVRKQTVAGRWIRSARVQG